MDTVTRIALIEDHAIKKANNERKTEYVQMKLSFQDDGRKPGKMTLLFFQAVNRAKEMNKGDWVEVTYTEDPQEGGRWDRKGQDVKKVERPAATAVQAALPIGDGPALARDEGMAWGNSVNAAVALLGHYMAMQSSIPSSERDPIDAMANATLRLATRIYNGRPGARPIEPSLEPEPMPEPSSVAPEPSPSDAMASAKPEAAQKPPIEEDAALPDVDFKNVGELLTRASKEYRMSMGQVFQACGVTNVDQLARDLPGNWAKIRQYAQRAAGAG